MAGSERTHGFARTMPHSPGSDSCTLVRAEVDERHGTAIRLSAVKSLAEGLRVGKRVRLHVARRARSLVIGRCRDGTLDTKKVEFGLGRRNTPAVQCAGFVSRHQLSAVDDAVKAIVTGEHRVV